MIDPDIPASITDEPQVEPMQPDERPEQAKRTTDEIDTDDLFEPSAL